MNKFYRSKKLNKAMTYIELVVVLGIFSMMAGITTYNYGVFQTRVDLQNLSSDIALKASQAEKDSSSGRIPPLAVGRDPVPTWKPSYGLYFNQSSSIANPGKSFIYYVDVNNDHIYNGPDVVYFQQNPGFPCTGECLEVINITKGNYISEIMAIGTNGSQTLLSGLSALSFTRPSTLLTVSDAFNHVLPNIDYVRITISTPKGANSVSRIVKLYSSGRLQIN
ncbi:MAG: type II secretion system protein [Patescibacteria group bacterium]